MDMLEVHKKSRDNKAQIRFHEFKSTYQNDSKVIYAFCEGKDDLSFYRSAIENFLCDNWTVQMWEVGGIDNVVELHNKFDWRTYNNSQIVFFIDRDLTKFTGVKLPNKKNMYITDNYSIENDVVNWNTCERILTEVLGLSCLSIEEKDMLKKLFGAELSHFVDQMVPIMSWIIEWRRCKHKACLKDIFMNHLFRLEKGELKSVPKPKRYQDATEYIHKQCNLIVDRNFDLTQGCNEFRTGNRHKKFTRGKYLIWFLTEFCLSIHRDCLQIPFIKSTSTQPRNMSNFSHSCAIIIISSRYRVPRYLRDFLKDTVESFVQQREAA